MSRTQYRYVQLKDGTSIPNPHLLQTGQHNRQDKTHVLDSHDRETGKELLVLEREGDSLFVRSIKNGTELEIPWDSVRHAVRLPTQVAKAKP